MWAVETIIAKRLLGSVPSLVVGAGRMGIGLVLLVGYLVVTGKLGGIASVTAEGWGWVLVTGFLLAGYVTTWMGALQRAPASVVTAVLVLGAVITTLLQSLVAGTLPSATWVVGAHVLGAGVAIAGLIATRDTAVGPAPARAGA
jgi:drug/metabolite transporter (DMT)-like permease